MKPYAHKGLDPGGRGDNVLRTPMIFQAVLPNCASKRVLILKAKNFVQVTDIQGPFAYICNGGSRQVKFLIYPESPEPFALTQPAQSLKFGVQNVRFGEKAGCL
jgi:hypothetical protein